MRATSQQHDGRRAACPPWCRRDHRPDDHVDDLLHQSGPAFVEVVHGDPRFGADERAVADTLVLRLAQRSGSPTVWLEASSEEGHVLHFLVSAESAARLAGGLTAVLAAL